MRVVVAGHWLYVELLSYVHDLLLWTYRVTTCMENLEWICLFFMSSELQLCVCFFILHSCCSIVSAVGWTCWDWSLIHRTLFLQCFDTVGWFIWPVKPVPNMTYNVFGGPLSLTQSINRYGHGRSATNPPWILQCLDKWSPWKSCTFL